VGFVALTVYDIHWQELPDRIVWPLVVLAFAQTVFLMVAKQSDWHVFLWAALGVAVISGLFWLLFEVSKGNWIGFGDVKLGIVLGLLAGTPLAAMLVIFFASVLGTLASVPTLLKAKNKMQLHIPFGPFLISGLVIVYFFGSTIIDWYAGLIY
jgi:prepilin signal peptidase PulO-like enzyme (type II secretory pathway)